MSAPNAGPGAQAPGAPSMGGQIGGAGLLAPGTAESSPEVRLEELKKQFEELKEKFYEMCTPFINAAHDPEAWIVYALRAYDYLVSGNDYFVSGDPVGVMTEYMANILDVDVNEVEERVKAVNERVLRSKVKSLERVIKTCDKKKNLLDFFWLDSSIRYAEMEAERKDHEEILELVEKLREMTAGEFIEKWEDIVDKLGEYDNSVYDFLITRIYQALKFDNLLGDTLDNEISYLARRVLRATEKQAKKIVRCLIEC